MRIKEYCLNLTKREIDLLNSWLQEKKEEHPTHYNEYTYTVFDKVNELSEELFRKQVEAIEKWREHEEA